MTAKTLAYRAARRAVRPKSPLTVSEWADANRVLSREGSSEVGRWRTARVPYQREIMDCLSEDSPIKKVVFMASSQVGKTEIGSNWLGYIITHAKGAVGLSMPTEKTLEKWKAQKFDPMARDTEAVAKDLARRSNKTAGASATRQSFVGGDLYFITAGSTSELKSISLRYIIADEIDEYAWNTGQGDPVGLLEVRQKAIHDRKILVVSSPTVKDASRIEEQYDLGDQRRYHVPCPHCGEFQHLKWTNVRYQKGHGGRITRAWYICEECGAEIDEHHKSEMLARGRWIAGNPDGAWRSYHISSIYTPIGLGPTWAELSEEWILAQDDNAKLMRFINTNLGEPWQDRKHDIKPNDLLSRAEPYPLRTLPPGVMYLTAGVDTQDDRLEVRVVGWGMRDGVIHEWVIDYNVFHGRPVDPKLWDALDEYLCTGLDNAYGKTLYIEATAIDSGGHYTHDVYAFVRRSKARRVIAIKGASQHGRSIISKPSWQDVNWRGQTIKKGVALYIVGSGNAKTWIYGRLNDDANKDAENRCMHFSSHLEPWFFDQQVAETFNPRKNRWELKKGKRNEVLDTHVYAIAASQHPEINLHKKSKGEWKRRALMLEPEQTTDQTPTEATAAETTPPPTYRGRPRRRVVSASA